MRRVEKIGSSQIGDHVSGQAAKLCGLNHGELIALVERLKNSLPPLLDGIRADGSLRLERTDFRRILHAGWVFWSGRSALSPPSRLSFMQTNQLCNQALLQQRAINEFLGP